MAHVILGLLLIRRQSLYDLIKMFEAGVSLFYSASSGSIKRALDSLLAQELIEVVSVEPGARGRKVYDVTAAGQQEFRTWMTGELTGPNSDTAMLSRLYFLGLLAPEERPVVLRRITARIETDLSELRALGDRIENEHIPEGYADIATYQRATLDYGISSSRFALDWLRERLDEEG